MTDLEAVDHDLHTSLKWTLENDISGVLGNDYTLIHLQSQLQLSYHLLGRYFPHKSIK